MRSICQLYSVCRVINTYCFIIRRGAKNNIFLVGDVNHQTTGAKLRSNRQVLAVLFFNIREVKLIVSESANVVIGECIIFWKRARIPTKTLPDCLKKQSISINFGESCTCKKTPQGGFPNGFE